MKNLLFVYILLMMLLCCTTETDRNRMRVGLDSINVLNRTEQPFTVQDVEPYVDFFDRHGNSNDQMLAHYLLGRAYHEHGEAPMALQCYQDAAERADTTAADCDFALLCRIYGQMADLFHNQRSPRLELNSEHQAVNFAWKAKDTLAAITFYGYLSGAYHMLNKMDSVLYVVKETERLCQQIGCPGLASAFLPMAIDIYLQRNDNSEAKLAMDKYERYSGFFDSSGNIQPSKVVYFKYKGIYYENTGKLDSAEYYYREMLANQPDLNRKEAGYKGLLSLFHRWNSPDSIAKYSLLYCQTNDSASFAHSADEIVRAQALYNYEEQQRIAHRKEREASYYKNLMIISSVILLLIAVVLYSYFKKMQQRKRAELIAANTEYASLLHQYEQLQHDMKLSQHDMSKYRQEKEQETQVLLQKLALFQDVPQIMDHWNIEKAMLDSLIVSELHSLARQAKQPSSKQWKELREFVEQELPTFFNKIDNKEVCLSPQEVLTSILIRLQFSQGELSALFGVSKQRVNNIKRSINHKLFSEEGAATLNQNITSM